MSSKSKREMIRERRQNKKRRRRWLAAGAGLLTLLALATFIFWPRPKAEPVSQARLEDDPSIGPASAPVTIVEYADFNCPSCRSWYNSGILQQILDEYGDKVRFVWRDFPVITPQSPKAAEAAQCAYDQGKFWEFHDLLYANAPTVNVSTLKNYAADIGLDTTRFNQCLDSGMHRETVRRDWRDAEAHGFMGTPSFLINNQPLVGPPTADLLRQRINSILASRG
jgi:protein-disulfide isomerase